MSILSPGRGVTLEGLPRPLVPSLVAARRALLACGGQPRTPDSYLLANAGIR